MAVPEITVLITHNRFRRFASKRSPRVRGHGGPKSNSDAVRPDRLSESAKRCGPAKLAATETAETDLSISARKPVAPALLAMTVTRSGRASFGDSEARFTVAVRSVSAPHHRWLHDGGVHPRTGTPRPNRLNRFGRHKGTGCRVGSGDVAIVPIGRCGIRRTSQFRAAQMRSARQSQLCRGCIRARRLGCWGIFVAGQGRRLKWRRSEFSPNVFGTRHDHLGVIRSICGSWSRSWPGSLDRFAAWRD